MKRSLEDSVGRPDPERPRPDALRSPSEVAIAVSPPWFDARGGLGDAETQVVTEVAEFLGGLVDPEAPLLAVADPIFRERLRRRLWRLHLMVQTSTSRDRH